jgi:hypothetical protein
MSFRTARQPAIYKIITIVIVALLFNPSSTAQGTHSASMQQRTLPKNAVLKGRVTIDRAPIDAASARWNEGGVETVDYSKYKNVIKIGGACEGQVFVECDPTQSELVTSPEKPELFHVTTIGTKTDISLVPWATPLHLKVRTPDLLILCGSNNITFNLNTRELRALATSFSGTCTVRGKGDIDLVDFGGAGSNRLMGTGFTIRDCIVGGAGTNYAEVVPKHSLYARGAGAVRVKAYGHPPFLKQQGSDIKVEWN